MANYDSDSLGAFESALAEALRSGRTPEELCKMMNTYAKFKERVHAVKHHSEK